MQTHVISNRANHVIRVVSVKIVSQCQADNVMAEGPSAAPERTTDDRSRDKEKLIKKVFSSPQWYYPIHKYIGDIVQG